MRLALFDLDHTLIAFDSGMAWTQFLVDRGVLPAGAEAVYLQHCHDYVAGTLDIRAMHRASVAPLARYPADEIDAWAHDFAAALLPRIGAEMQAVVARHRAAGDLCAIVTATTRFVAQPIAPLFAVEHLLCTEPARRGDFYDGEIAGEPCFREHKIAHVERWLASRGASLAGVEASWFYSDSASDLPLLRAVSHPVAVRPDARLREEATRRGWPVIEAV